MATTTVPMKIALVISLALVLVLGIAIGYGVADRGIDRPVMSRMSSMPGMPDHDMGMSRIDMTQMWSHMGGGMMTEAPDGMGGGGGPMHTGG